MTQKKVIFGIIGCGLMGRAFSNAAARWCHVEGLDVRPAIPAMRSSAVGV